MSNAVRPVWSLVEEGYARVLVGRKLRYREIAEAMTARFGRPFSKESVRAKLVRRPSESNEAADFDVDLSDLESDAAPPTQRSVRAPEVEDEPESAAPEAQRAPRVTVEEPIDPVAARAKRDEVASLKRQVADLVDRLREATAREKFIDEATAYRAPPAILPRERTSGLREFTPCVTASDWHCEEPVSGESVAFRNEYNLEIADKRIERFFRAIIWNVEHHRASGRIAIRDLILWLGGDLYSGGIHDDLVQSNPLSATEAIRWLLPRLRNGIATLLERLNLERIVVPCSFGNHGRVTAKPRVATGYAMSFDWLMYLGLADEFRDDKRVTFEITASAHQYVEVYGQTIHFHHGDSLKYMGGVGGLGIPLLKAVPAWERVRPSDVHVIGHFHQLRDYGRAVVNGSLIGYGPYSMHIRADFEEPQQAMFYMDKERGKSMLTALWCAEKSSDQRETRS